MHVHGVWMPANLGAFVARRMLSLIPVLLAMTLISFSMMHLIPGDPVQYMFRERRVSAETYERVREDFGLNLPLHIQYFRFLTNLLHGELGYSFRSRRSVIEEMSYRLPVTLTLAIGGTIISLMIGILTGVISAIKQYSLLDYSSMLGALLGVCMPEFWLGLMLILMFGVYLRWFPVSGGTDIKSFILPFITLGIGGAAVLARLTRSSMLEVLRQDYIRTVRAKGLRERLVIYRHALRNALIPVLTMATIQFGYLLMGTVLVETVFALSGIGRLSVTSIIARDIPLVQGIVLFYGSTFVLINLVTDIAYAFIDPRIRY